MRRRSPPERLSTSASSGGQRVHRLFDLAVEVPQALRLDLVLQPRHFVGGLIGIVHRQFVVAIENVLFGGDAEHDIAAHAKIGIEMRLLREIADARAFCDKTFAVKFGVDAGHDAQQRRFAGAVDAEHADLGRRVERQMHVLEHFLAAGPGLGQAFHVINELLGHARRGPREWQGLGLPGW
jgi:hypothetical protein